MTEIRVLFNVLSILKKELIFEKVKSLGIKSISIFGNLGYEKLPKYFELVSKEFKDVVVNLYHIPTYQNMPNWPKFLQKDAERIISALSEININNYAWMIELNLYGQRFNPLVKNYVNRNKLEKNFNLFYKIAHDINPDAKVIIVPYPHALMNLRCGLRGWKDWWIKHGEKLKFDLVSLNAHIGTWIPAPTKHIVYKHLSNSIDFLKKLGHSIYYVEVGYPTVGHKPFLGWYGFGREKDQVTLLQICYRIFKDRDVKYMQICEFIDPNPKKQNYETFFGKEGKSPRFMGIPVSEENHWGLLRNDGTEKLACKWIKKVTK